VELSLLAGHKAVQEEGDLSKAAREYKQAVELDPNSYLGHLSLANVQRLQGDLVGSEKSFRRCTVIRPQEVSSYADLGTVLVSQGNEDASLRHALHTMTSFPEQKHRRFSCRVFRDALVAASSLDIHRVLEALATCLSAGSRLGLDLEPFSSIWRKGEFEDLKR